MGYGYRGGCGPLELVREAGGKRARYWYALDARGDVSGPLDAAGRVVQSYRYDEWGAPLSLAGTVGQPPPVGTGGVEQPLGYRGYRYDAALGWYWLSVRPYDPASHRHPCAGTRQPDPSGQEAFVGRCLGGAQGGRV